MRRVWLVCVALAGCGAKPSPPGEATPSKVLSGFVFAADEGDLPALAKLFPPPDVVRASVDCEAAVTDIEEERAKVERRVTEGRARGARLEFDGVETLGTQKMAPGDASGDCHAKQLIEERKVNLRFKVTMNGVTTDETQKLRLVKLAGRWYLEGM